MVVLIPLGRGGTTTSIAESKAKYAVAGWLEDMARHPISFKLAGGDAFSKERVEGLARSYLDERDRHFRVVFRQLVGALTIEVVASVALLALGGLLVIERQLSLGQLVAAELIVTAVVASIAKLGGKVEIFYDLVAAVDKLGEILDLPLERADGKSPTPKTKAIEARGMLALRGVELDLGPGQADDPVSLSLRPGQWLSVSGASEQVTTTLVDALFGLHPPRAGTIEIDGYDSRDLSLRELRSRIALVRGTEVLPGSIEDNLRAAKPDLSAEQAWTALRAVGLERWVKDTPSGLQTEVLRDAAPLSRAQAIQLTIARALAGEPSVLILDRTLDRLGPGARERVLDGLLASGGPSGLLVSNEPELLARTDEHLDLGESATAQEGAA